MDNNLKLRKAIIIAIALMGTGYSMHSKAIGLGDILVKSYLGQPLLADVKVNGINKKMDGSCFSVNSNAANAISDVKFKLNRLANDEGVLTITSKSAVLEPIASLTIVSNCDTTFARQYDLLIDPANLTNNVASTQDFTNSYAASTSVTALNLVESASNSTQEVSANVKGSTNTQPKRTAKSNSTVKSSTKVSTPNISVAKSTPAATTTKNVVAEAQPRLTISGSSFFNNSLEPAVVKLKFDKSINTSRESNPNAYAEEAAFSDEITVMNNRLAHLDKQLNTLRVQNTSLKNANLASNTQIEEIKKENDFLRVLSFFFGGALLASSYFFIDWYRRRTTAAKAQKEQALWEALEGDFKENDPVEVPAFAKDKDDTLEVSSHAKVEVTNKDEFSEDSPTHVFSSIYSHSDSDFVEEDTNVLDDAKLFLSHGRVGLAIQLLQSHLIDFPRESAENWLLLLDLLAKEGRQEEFETAANECEKYFNVDIPKFSQNTEPAGGIESYERISLDLQKVWGTAEATNFLDNLIHNARNEPREGFNKELFEELVLLREIAEEEIKLAQVIQLKNQKTTTKAKKEASVTHRFPEIEISEEFKELGKKLELENSQKGETEPEMDHFEFELLDIAHR